MAKQKPRPLGLVWLTFLCYAVQQRELNAPQALLYDLLCTIYIHSVVLNSINTFMVNQFISCSSSRARCHRFFNFMLALLILLALCFHPKKGHERDGCLPLFVLLSRTTGSINSSRMWEELLFDKLESPNCVEDIK